jgi:hypothetical protein
MSTNTILATTPLVSTNYLLRATGTTIGNSLIFDNGTNVGIGNTNTTYKLDISGITRIGGISLPYLDFKTTDTVGAGYQYKQISYSDATNTELWNIGYNYPNLQFYVGGTRVTTFTSSGNVAIGTTTSTWRLTAASGSDSLYNVLGVFNNGITGTSAIGKGTGIVLGGNTDGNYSAKIAMVYEGQNPSYLQPALAFYTMRDTYAYGSEVERMRITSGGVLCVGTTSGFTSGLVCADGGTSYVPFAAKVGTTANSTQIFFNNPNGVVGSITTSGSVTTYNVTSDYRLKQDLKDYNGLGLVSSIKTYDYEWKSDNTRMYGVMAHELAEILPYAVQGEKDGEQMQSVDYSKLTPILVKAIQELSAKNEELSNRLIKLESK